MSSNASETESPQKYLLTIQSANFRFETKLVVEARDQKHAEEIFEEQYDGYEIEVQTLPHDGSTWETVFAPSETDAKNIATGRKGEYAETPKRIEVLKATFQVSSVQILEGVDSREADEADAEFRRISAGDAR
jgi:hypothetical protein